MWFFFSASSLRFVVSWWMALADNVLWTYLWHLPRRSSYGAAGQQEATSSLSKHHGESMPPGLLVDSKPRRREAPAHLVTVFSYACGQEPWLTTVKTRIHYLWSIHRCLSPTGNCHQSEVLSCLTLPSPVLQSEESPGWGLGGNRQSQDLPLSVPFCQNVVKQWGSIFHSTQLSIFLEDERTTHLDPWWTREEELHGSLTQRALTW